MIIENVNQHSSRISTHILYHKENCSRLGNNNNLWTWGENKTAEEYVDVEYISLYRYIRNTPSDAEVHAEHHLREDRST